MGIKHSVVLVKHLNELRVKFPGLHIPASEIKLHESYELAIYTANFTATCKKCDKMIRDATKSEIVQFGKEHQKCKKIKIYKKGGKY